MNDEEVYDCIIIGAGPGGLQAAIYLGRYNMRVLLVDRGGGRTMHARHIENFLTQKVISGRQIIETGIEQARAFHVQIEEGAVSEVLKREFFEVLAGDRRYLSRFVVVSSGVYDNFPPIENIHKFLGEGFFTCVDCDGYKTTGRKLVLIGNSLKTVHLALAMKEMFTKDITLILYNVVPPEGYMEELKEENIRLITDRPLKVVGGEKIEGLELKSGEIVECEVIMSNFGYKLNDGFLSGLNLKRDAERFKFAVNHNCESSLDGLYVVGPLNTGHDQVVIAAGEGAIAALDIKKRLLNP